MARQSGDTRWPQSQTAPIIRQTLLKLRFKFSSMGGYGGFGGFRGWGPHRDTTWVCVSLSREGGLPERWCGGEEERGGGGLGVSQVWGHNDTGVNGADQLRAGRRGLGPGP